MGTLMAPQRLASNHNVGWTQRGRPLPLPRSPAAHFQPRRGTLEHSWLQGRRTGPDLLPSARSCVKAPPRCRRRVVAATRAPHRHTWRPPPLPWPQAGPPPFGLPDWLRARWPQVLACPRASQVNGVGGNLGGDPSGVLSHRGRHIAASTGSEEGHSLVSVSTRGQRVFTVTSMGPLVHAPLEFSRFYSRNGQCQEDGTCAFIPPSSRSPRKRPVSTWRVYAMSLRHVASWFRVRHFDRQKQRSSLWKMTAALLTVDVNVNS